MKQTRSTKKEAPRMSKVAEPQARYRSEVFEALHRSASALHEVGAMDAQTMRNFDVACIAKPQIWSKRRIQLLRKKNRMSQPVFAAYLNSTPSTIAQWESGAKRPSNIAAKLLQVLDKHGPDVLR